MPNPHVDQYVYLIPQQTAENQISWTWLYKGQSGPASSFPPIEVKKGSGQNDIHLSIVNLQPPQQQQIKFAGYDGPDISKAISMGVKSLTGPPQKPTSGITSNGEVKNITFDQQGSQLVIENLNGKKLDLLYSLNFVDAANNNQAVTSIDPEIRNGGGGGKFFDYLTAPLLLSGLVAGALVGLAIARWGLGWR